MTDEVEQEVVEDQVTDEVVSDEDETTPDNEVETTETEADDESEPGSEDEASEEDEVVVTIGDEEPLKDEASAAPEWVRELRKAHRETQRENRELKAKLEVSQQPAKVEVGAKPNLEDFDYDTEEYDKALTNWHERKRAADARAAELEKEQKAQDEAWQRRLTAYGEAKSKLKVKDFDDAEAMVLETLDQTQQGIIVQGAENSALVMYALGKNPERVKELAQIKDPVKFAFTVAKLEKDLKVTNRKAPPPPEKTVNGTAPKSGSVDSTLERLRAEAEKSGNYTKVRQYKQQQRQKAKR